MNLKYSWFLIFLFYFSFQESGYSQKLKITDDINYLYKQNNIINNYTQFQMINDYNPIFDPKTNDEGYTLGLNIKQRFKSKNSYQFFDLTLNSDLYSQYQYNDIYQLNGRAIYPQYFVEISTLDLQFYHYLKSLNLFLSLDGGIGINNKEKAIWGLSLYIQGGKDGKTGYHGLLKNNHGEDNLASGPIAPIFYLSPSLVKFFTIDAPGMKNKPFVKLEAGARLGTKTIGSNIFFNAKAKIPLFQWMYNSKNLFLLSANLQDQIILHQDGLLMLPEFGLETQICFFTFGFNSIFIEGKQNLSVIKYADNETLMRAYVKFNF